ncbi:hypothetical protein STABA_v1c03730 [Spiroplasma tabanidicola]|uniref:Transposase n=1 Tax=Spiroplasma tabanidicola TaxID=324079 RepID=A0A6I6C7G4_9MOLU|nr:hypothetical protein STABA_v1c03730 [Spiroplasma tabanidicola]
MAKQWSKQEKINIVNEAKEVGIINTAVKFNLSTSTIKR